MGISTRHSCAKPWRAEPRAAGAEVYRFTSVTGLTQHADDSWTVQTDKGDIRAQIVVNACGYRVNEVGAMMGVEHPVASMEHQYFITEDMPGVMGGRASDPTAALPHLRLLFTAGKEWPFGRVL